MCNPQSWNVQHTHEEIEALPLIPISAPGQALSLTSTMHSRHGNELGTRRVLMRQHGSLAYASTSLLTERPKTGITLLKATTMMQERPSSSRFLPCGPSSAVVIKVVPRSDNSSSCEVAAMQLLVPHQLTDGHSHVIRLLDCLQDNDNIYLVLPYLAGGDLFDKVEASQGKGLPEVEAANYLHQACQGLLFMKQSAGLSHHDVSLENMMFTTKRQDVLQIIDLGMCLRMPQEGGGDRHEEEDIITNINNNNQNNQQEEQQPQHHHHHYYLSPQRPRGKPAYIAPEVLYQKAYDPFAADVWSLGVCLYMMLAARPLYDHPNTPAFKIMARGGVRAVLDAYSDHGLTPLSDSARDLVVQMLQADPTKRPTLEEILTHPFMLSTTSC